MQSILQNPINNEVGRAIQSAKSKIDIAVPFITHYAKSFLNSINFSVDSKRLITKLDDSSLTSFDIPTLIHFVENGFEIRYNNDIHLKLYMFDDQTYVTSSNFTRSGFETAIELTVRVEKDSVKQCSDVFSQLWESDATNSISQSELESLLPKYETLKKTQRTTKAPPKKYKDTLNSNFDVTQFIEKVAVELNHKRILEDVGESYKIRKRFYDLVESGEFEEEDFLADEGSEKRKECLYYHFTYGVENKLAILGMREAQFGTILESNQVMDVISFINPQLVGLPKWDLNNEEELYSFCIGLFDYGIPNYSEAMPIRLASYFHKIFYPIFKLDTLANICRIMGFETNVKTKGERLFEYTRFLNDSLVFSIDDVYVRTQIAYSLTFAEELSKKLGEETFEEICQGRKVWEKESLELALRVLRQL